MSLYNLPRNLRIHTDLVVFLLQPLPHELWCTSQHYFISMVWITSSSCSSHLVIIIAGVLPMNFAHVH